MALETDERTMILAPIVRGRKGEFKKELEKLAKDGFLRARIDGQLQSLEESSIKLDKRSNHTIEVVIDRFPVRPGIEKRLESSIETAMKLTGGIVLVSVVGGEEQMYSQTMACVDCGTSIPVLEPRSFSFNSMYGACKSCNGLGSKWQFDPNKFIVDWSKPLLDGGLGPGGSNYYITRKLQDTAQAFGFDLDKPFGDFTAKIQNIILYGATKDRFRFEGIVSILQKSYDEGTSDSFREWYQRYMSGTPCQACQGKRLRPESLAVLVSGLSIGDFTAQPVSKSAESVRKISLTTREEKIAGRVLKEIAERLEFLNALGLGYLTLDRSAATLSGGEGQRVRLATQIGSKLRGVLYVLDEPSIGLHARDNERLLGTLTRLRDLGNTVLVVEHDEETIRRADYVLDLGPRAGRHGGGLVAAGTPAAIELSPDSLTGDYLSGRQSIPVPERRLTSSKSITITGASEHNLKSIDVSFPLGLLTVVTGVSGSGKSTLVNDILFKALAKHLYGSRDEPGAHRDLKGADQIDKVIRIDQSPIGRTPRSNPATYTGTFSPIRDLFALLPESRERGYKPGRFSFNVKGGRCEACQGDGQKRIEMSFLPDVYVTCDVCQGRRYNHETLQVKYKGNSVADLLNTPIQDALAVLENIPQIKVKLQTLIDVGLGYIQLGQSSTTLSGGEAQRIKLAKELSRRQTGRTLYLLDEPTTGLHFDDVRKLLEVLARLTALGNTVIIIEHHPDVIKSADWVIDLGPEGGEFGGRLVAQGTPEQVARSKRSFTGEMLEKVLQTGGSRRRK
jgi:excinuclease ABC subunit A